MKCQTPRVVVSALLLFIAILGTGIAMLYVPRDHSWDESVIEDEPSFILSDHSSNYTYERAGLHISQIEIASVTTNDTAIVISVANLTNTKLMLHNVTRMRHLPIEVNPGAQETIIIIFSRMNQTASVRVEILIHVLVPPPLNPGFPIFLFLPIIAVPTLFWVGYHLIKIRWDCWNPFLKKKGAISNLDRFGPLAVIILIIVSSALISPLLSGILGNRYQTETREVELDQLKIADTLNESNTVVSYDFNEIADSYNVSISAIRVHSFQFGEVPFQMELRIDDESNQFMIDELSSSPELWFEPNFSFEPCILHLKRVDSDLQITFVIEIITIEEVPKNDPTFPMILAICGAFILVVVTYRAWQIESILKEKAPIADG
ncbi:MAG: hypothetical protein R6V83_13630 [Candidatus Thorarchaeota archaeon]